MLMRLGEVTQTHHDLEQHPTGLIRFAARRSDISCSRIYVFSRLNCASEKFRLLSKHEGRRLRFSYFLSKRQTSMIFSYWTGESGIFNEMSVPSTAAWRARFHEYRVFRENDVIEILTDIHPDFVDMFKRISIPACKSDIARLLLLYKFGGLYVDAHTGPGHSDMLVKTFDVLSAFELLLYDRTWECETEGDIHLMNTVMGARRGSKVLLELLTSALANLSGHLIKEDASDGYVPYNIFVLTGAWDITTTLCDRSKLPIRLFPKYCDSIFIYPLQEGEQPGFNLYEYYGYREPGRHWSERQNSERLFARAD